MSGLHLSRRQVLAAMAVCGVGVAGCRASGGSGGSGGSGASGPTTTASGPTTAPAATLPPGLVVARRFSFGPTPDLVASAAAGAEAFVDAQLAAGGADGGSAAGAIVDALDARLAEVAATGDRADPRVRRAAAEVAIGRTLALAAWSDAQLRAVMADFFADHLHVSLAEAPEVLFVPSYDRDVIRAGALGTFRDLLIASARSAAMLVYLDNARSRADGPNLPNENYGRELLELHTVGVDGGYDEADVVEVAHVLSGWTLARPATTFAFRPAWHDLGSLRDGGDVLGWRPAGAGERDGEDLLAHLAAHPSTARFLSWKLARRFVADDVGADAELVGRLADVYLASDTAIGPVLRELAASDELAAAGGAKLRRPLDLVAAILRMGFAPPDPGAFERPARVAARRLQALGQLPYQWPAPNGFPEAAGAWTGAGALVGRWNLASEGATGFGGLTARQGSADADANAMARSLLGTEPGTALASALIRADDPAGVTARALTFASPEFQLR